ncbi:MAG: F0F1 ATP synthase subunit A [Ignavibacteria bacterium]|nr:F0F1 ATP synthase subunit A [Ignavibacteria bacterium]
MIPKHRFVYSFFVIVLFTVLFSARLFAEEPKTTHGDDNKLDIIEKVVDHNYVDFYFLGKLPLPSFPKVTIGGITFDFSVTKSLFMLLLSSTILFFVLRRAAVVNTKNPVPKGVGNLIETVVLFIRDEIVLPNMGKEGLKLLPFFLTLFFFILFANLIGMIPFMAQPTKNISVTTGLALITFSMIQVNGMKKNGVLGYFKGLVPHGIPVFVLPIMIIVEFIGLFTKPFALLMRLFANITAGSIIIMSLLGLIFIMNWAGVAIAIPFALFIDFLELFVALLQAYIFTMLSVIFINMAIHQH